MSFIFPSKYFYPDPVLPPCFFRFLRSEEGAIKFQLPVVNQRAFPVDWDYGYQSHRFFLRLFVPFLTFSKFKWGEVSFAEFDDRIEVLVDGKLFSAWQHKAWLAGFFYPVIGPDGENITRHYPMKKDFPNEQTDHPHHRSIRFAHRDVNGFSYWAPDRQRGDRTASIKLVEVIKGENGNLKIVNDWIGNGQVILRETMHLRFQPLNDGEMLMDYDVEISAREDVTFHDQKDGGMMIRVAGTMKAYDQRGKKKGNGVITNSHGDLNEATWGKRAEWCDYSGPGLSGKPVGIAIFDHPSNLRFPAHWHARTYGLLTCNRFGKGHFEGRSGARKGDGDYTIDKGETLKIRHRLYFHHGDAKAAGVAKMFDVYAEKG